jgi:hypothetical protein
MGKSALALWNHYACQKDVAGDGAYYIHEHFHSVFWVLSIKHCHNVVDAGNNEEAKEAKQDNAANRMPAKKFDTIWIKEDFDRAHPCIRW